MFSEVIEQEKTPREDTVNPSSEELVKKTEEESPTHEIHDRLTTTMAKEEIGN